MMTQTYSLAGFRCRFITYLVLTAFVAAFLPSVAEAQHVTATLVAPTGTVLVNGLAAEPGVVLAAGDTIETGENAGVVLELSDGSQIEIGANTQIDLAQLTQTGSGARVSKIKLAWGWMRAKLSPGHQNEGSTFDVETPNALIGVKFSQPDVEVRYTPDTQETEAIAHTVALAIKNLLTGEEGIVPVGSSVIITLTAVKIATGIVEAGVAAAKMSTTTKVVIGAGAVIGIGGGIALASGGSNSGSSDSGGSDKNFSGQFEASDNWGTGGWIKTIELTQTGNTISGTVRLDEFDPDCSLHGDAHLSGEVLSATAARAYPTPATLPVVCTQGNDDHALPNPFEMTLHDGGNTLYVGDPWGIHFDRQ